ncbi:folylpolyglutamate synthase signature 2 [Lucifera butyrica]|uniref:tetrahydrofolate synthase n=1 Tax=Lucifera butyrica TaxID=1351585 RepID=A0A498RB27_9FIRM|nr:folylpolyglutamate synthase/dihydrofolate synthase family protein [Lucifera butyrica]VBB06318.1 folylpolyglutamate synthase signature 2 [Lucifera butyrica]
MTYEQALNYLASLGKFGISLGLKRVENLLDRMGHPERSYKTIHITGTNGKGSATAMLTAVLTASGLKTGMYTSPHLIDYTERMAVDGRPVPPGAFAEAIDHTRRFVEEMIRAGGEQPTEFEVLTAAAFFYFAKAGVDYAVIEVGLGGLLDSTNVVVPELAMITNVTLEHTDRCGATIREIAVHKAGIIKAGVPVVTAAQGEALDVIRQACIDTASSLYVLDEDFYAEFAGMTVTSQDITVKTVYGDCGLFRINLLGHHQVKNAAIVVMAAMVLSRGEPRITVNAIRDGLAGAVWPGRFEIIPGNPVIVIDGAHNPDGAAALRRTLDDVFPGRPVVFLLGILRDKDVDGIIAALIREEDTVVVVPPLSERAAEPEEIAPKIKARQVEVSRSIAAGLEKAGELAHGNSVLCIAGSLYLAGEARKIVKKIK